MELLQETAYKNIIQMLRDRNYTIESDDNLKIFAKHENKKILILARVIPKLNIEEIEYLAESLDSLKINHALIVYTGVQTPAAKSALENMSKNNYFVECFHVGDLQINPTKHILVPKHELLDKVSSNKIKSQTNDGKDLPNILKSDVIARYYNYKHGQVIKITRADGSIALRIVK